jgi:hypothetical protein
LLGCLVSTAAPRFSGPLARQHQFLDGACTADCHKIGGGKPEFRCIGCHSDIGARVAGSAVCTGRITFPLAQPGVRAFAIRPGANFPLIEVGSQKFDHKRQISVDNPRDWIAECHLQKEFRQRSAQRKSEDLNRTFLGVPQTCVCHKDFHEGRG